MGAQEVLPLCWCQIWTMMLRGFPEIGDERYCLGWAFATQTTERQQVELQPAAGPDPETNSLPYEDGRLNLPMVAVPV